MRLFRYVFFAVWLLIFALAAVLPAVEKARPYSKAIFIAMFVLQAFCIPPLFVRLFWRLQEGIGNIGIARWVASHEWAFAAALWSLWGAGAMVVGAYFLLQLPIPLRSHGLLVFDLGMSMDEVTRRSTVKVPPPKPIYHSGALSVGQDPYDLQLGDAGPQFSKCRYFWLSSNESQPPYHVARADIGLSQRKMPKAEAEKFIADVGSRLASAGWSRGYYDWSKAAHPDWHRGGTNWDGYLWARGNTFVRLFLKQMDDKADEYIVTAEVLPLADQRNSALQFH